jgi:hypothetical protein
MSVLHSLWFIAGVVFVLNLPFGYWRAGSRRFSRPWLVSIHAPVILAIGIRLLVGIRFVLGSVPLFVGAFFLGQSLGGRLRSRRLSAGASLLSERE